MKLVLVVIATLLARRAHFATAKSGTRDDPGAGYYPYSDYRTGPESNYKYGKTAGGMFPDYGAIGDVIPDDSSIGDSSLGYKYVSPERGSGSATGGSGHGSNSKLTGGKGVDYKNTPSDPGTHNNAVKGSGSGSDKAVGGTTPNHGTAVSGSSDRSSSSTAGAIPESTTGGSRTSKGTSTGTSTTGSGSSPTGSVPTPTTGSSTIEADNSASSTIEADSSQDRPGSTPFTNEPAVDTGSSEGGSRTGPGSSSGGSVPIAPVGQSNGVAIDPSDKLTSGASLLASVSPLYIMLFTMGTFYLYQKSG